MIRIGTIRVGTAALVAAMALSAFAQSADVASPFNGKDLAGWKLKGNNEAKSKWKVGKASPDPAAPNKFVFAEGGNELVNTAGGGVDIHSEYKHGNAVIEVELMVPKGSNSGVYVMGEYEVQVLDSFGKVKVGAGDLGGLYGAAAPKKNASKAPGEWQKFVIDFVAPRFDGKKKTVNAKFLKVTLNDHVMHENAEVLKGATPGGLSGSEAPVGPLMFQGDHEPVAFRNVKITPKK